MPIFPIFFIFNINIIKHDFLCPLKWYKKFLTFKTINSYLCETHIKAVITKWMENIILLIGWISTMNSEWMDMKGNIKGMKVRLYITVIWLMY